jgi:hypothetical protein
VATSAVDRLSAAEHLIDNPIPRILSQYDVNNNDVCEAFNTSAKGVLEALQETQDVYSKDTALMEKWSYGQTVIRTVVEALAGNVDYEALIQLNDELREITRNGFFYSSVVSIAFLPESEKLKRILDSFWQCLHQAEEIVLWLLATCPRVEKAVVPWYCYEVSALINTRQNKDAQKACTLLWYISLLNDIPPALEEFEGPDLEQAKPKMIEKLQNKGLFELIGMKT